MVHQPLVGILVGFETEYPFWKNGAGKAGEVFLKPESVINIALLGESGAPTDRFAGWVVDVHDGVHWLEIRLRRV
jgi:hypothetical protein